MNELKPNVKHGYSPKYRSPAPLVISHLLQEHVHSQQGTVLLVVLHTPSLKKH